MRSQRRIAVAAVATLFVVACGGPGKVVAKSEPTSTAPASGHPVRPLAVRADGTLDPDRIDLSGVAGVTPAEQKRAEDLLRRTIRALSR